jgi:DNA polymerase-3 subunit gamma/tau
MIEQLKRICDADGVQYEESIFAYIVREADGSLRDAESVLDQIIAYSGTSITEKAVIEVIGVVERELTFGIMKAVVEGDPKRGLEIIEDALEQGHDVYQIYRGLVSLLRDMLMIKVWKGKPPFLIIDDAEAARLLDLMGPLEYFEVQNMLNHLLQTEDLVRGIFPKVALEILFINLYNLTRLRDVEKIIEHLEPARSGARETRTPAAVERQAPERSSPRVQPPERRSTPPTAPERMSPAPRAQEKTPPPANRPPEEAAPVAAPPQMADGAVRDVRAFLAYLKEKQPFIGGMFESMDVTTEGDNIVVLLDKNHSLLRKDTDVTGEVKNQATEFFGRRMGLVFKDSEGPKVSTLEDYVKEAEVLFKA